MSSPPVTIQALSDAAPAARLEPEVAAARRTLTAVPDRATREAAAALARQVYCVQLKELRERRGITLEMIADRTKVSESLYAALERNDVSRWPTGIYRRSFFRGYATTIGLSDAAISEFLQLFPDDYDQRGAPAVPGASGPLRLTLTGRTWLRISRLQVLASVVDIIMVAAISAALGWWMPVAIGTITAVVAMIYYSLATACLACSPGSWWLRTRRSRKRARALRLAR